MDEGSRSGTTEQQRINIYDQDGVGDTCKDKFTATSLQENQLQVQLPYLASNPIAATTSRPLMNQWQDEFGLMYNFQIDEGTSTQTTNTKGNTSTARGSSNNERTEMGQCSANLFQWHSSSKLSQEMQGSYTSMLLGTQLFQENLQGQTQISDYCTGDDYVLSRKQTGKQMALDNMNSSPERNKDFNNSTTEFEDYQLRDWDEEYLSEPEEEQWQNGIFRNMEIQEIRERTSSTVKPKSKRMKEASKKNTDAA
ncbi:unnamed protein product [Miscanthus lutarioriparius]|uniref:Uncharacterized protein n=1 Tax=Miscanthus lutarioriparius TaxID=422564 RepID=A0A811R2E2_9POAL|nr:unnamed protein product [Miscanthus lutarioriparius]